MSQHGMDGWMDGIWMDDGSDGPWVGGAGNINQYGTSRLVGSIHQG